MFNVRSKVYSKLTIGLIFFIGLLLILNRFDWKENTSLQWDKVGYYTYLPAVFIYHDLDHLAFYVKMNEKYNFTTNKVAYATYPQKKTGRLLNKYPVGVSLLELPFFLIAHGITGILQTYPSDGYSSIYRLSVQIATLAWLLFGLLMLRKLLCRYFDDKTVACTLLLIALGTNLYCYSFFEAGMSHSFSFALFAAALNEVDLFYTNQKRRHLLLTSFWLGLIIIVRPTNLIFAIVLLLWPVNKTSNLRVKLQYLLNNKASLLLGALLCFGVVMIQLSYFKYITGDWIHFSYEEEGFNFLHPKILSGLFSYRKGWFVYTPLAFFGIGGFYMLIKKRIDLLPAIGIYILLNTYIVFSWKEWYYGGGFGARALIESFAVLAFPLSFFIEWLLISLRFKLIKVFCGLILILITGMNIWQTYQYSRAVIPWDNNNKAYYWKVFFKLNASEEDRKLLPFN